MVKYDNDMNTVNFKGYKEKELDLFFSICHLLQEQDTKLIKLSFEQVSNLANYDLSNLSRFKKDLLSTYDKLLRTIIKIRDNNGDTTVFTLFTKYKVSPSDRTIEIRVNEEFKYILNDVTSNYTKIELQELISIKSKYAKGCYRLLKQWNSTGRYLVELEEFKSLLGVPKKFTNSHLNRLVIKPILKELTPKFNGLTLNKIKKGKRITHFEFLWKLENKKIKTIINISKDLEETISKAKQNRFLAPHLNHRKLSKLLEIYEEQDLIKGLKVAKNEVNKEFSNLNYLKKKIDDIISIKIVSSQTSPDPQTVKTDEIDSDIELYKEELKVLIKKQLSKAEQLEFKGYLVPLKTKEQINDLVMKYNINSTLFNIETGKTPILVEKYKQLLELEIKKLEILNGSKDISLFEKIARKVLDAEYTTLSSKRIDVENIPSPDENSPTRSEEGSLQLVNYLMIDRDELLSKKGRLLSGGALFSRLQKIARDKKIKILYKDSIIE